MARVDSTTGGKKYSNKQREAGRNTMRQIYSEMRKAGITGGKRKPSAAPF